MSAALDGKPLPTLVGITADSCYDGYGGYELVFTATADMIPQAIDDEFGLQLKIDITDISQIEVGKTIDVADNPSILISTHPTSFLDPATLGPLTAVSGEMTLSRLSEREISGSAALTFSDPQDDNALVDTSLAYELNFTNLAVIHHCPEK